MSFTSRVKKRAAKEVAIVANSRNEVRKSGESLKATREYAVKAVAEIEAKIRAAATDEEAARYLDSLSVQERHRSMLDEYCELNEKTVVRFDELMSLLSILETEGRYPEIIKIIPEKQIKKLSRKPELLGRLSDLVNDLHNRCNDEIDLSMADWDKSVAEGEADNRMHSLTVEQHRRANAARYSKRLAELRGNVAPVDANAYEEATENNQSQNRA